MVTRKVAGLSVVTSELAEDSSPEATADSGEQSDGLASLTIGTGNVQDIAVGTSLSNLDAFAQAQMLAANTDSGKPLLQPEPTVADQAPSTN